MQKISFRSFSLLISLIAGCESKRFYVKNSSLLPQAPSFVFCVIFFRFPPSHRSKDATQASRVRRFCSIKLFFLHTKSAERCLVSSRTRSESTVCACADFICSLWSIEVINIRQTWDWVIPRLVKTEAHYCFLANLCCEVYRSFFELWLNRDGVRQNLRINLWDNNRVRCMCLTVKIHDNWLRGFCL